MTEENALYPPHYMFQSKYIEPIRTLLPNINIARYGLKKI